MPPSERRIRGRPRRWTKDEDRLLLALGEKFPQRGQLRQHLTDKELELRDQFPGKTIAALMIQHMRLVKAKRGSKTENGSAGVVTRTRGSAGRKGPEDIGDGEASDSESDSESDPDSGTENEEDRDTGAEKCSDTNSQRSAILDPVNDGESYPITYRAGSFMCKMDRPSPSPTEQDVGSGSSPSQLSPAEMARAGGRLSTAMVLYGNATKYHQENLMKERELLYAISEAADDIDVAEQRVQDARSRRENLRRELDEVRERVRVGAEMDRVLQRQLHQVDC
ncbi:uncharacterized protein APUU_60332A [Aspergillus puulaauensis]|uniref:Uncharacterized protein n=1 Tax=Aspergillus puulaauensis TaxID=1220207 RepID=A0A7R7XUZ5_9EURO|nr:uncharacterized protein APUU_60332A [Aspergillus puulaauensis]BCS27284.1 hypothetical protein APUU_60332A [Aspergillus puulaauensis]